MTLRNCAQKRRGTVIAKPNRDLNFESIKCGNRNMNVSLKKLSIGVVAALFVLSPNIGGASAPNGSPQAGESDTPAHAEETKPYSWLCEDEIDRRDLEHVRLCHKMCCESPSVHGTWRGEPDNHCYDGDPDLYFACIIERNCGAYRRLPIRPHINPAIPRENAP